MKEKSRRRASKGKKKSSELDAQATREIINSKILKEHCSCIRCLPVCSCLLSPSLKQSPTPALLWGSLSFTGFHCLLIFFGVLEAPVRELRRQDCLSPHSGNWILIFQVQLKGLCGLAPWVGLAGMAGPLIHLFHPTEAGQGAEEGVGPGTVKNTVILSPQPLA